MRFARFVAAVFCIPFVWALCRSFVDTIGFYSASDGFTWSIELVALLSGVVSFLALSRVLPAQNRIYVLGHELTHALWGLCFGAKVSGLKVRSSGGSVMLSKSNVWITLAPYFFPFWTAVVALLALAIRCVMYFACPSAAFPVPWAWMFAVGFTWCFHMCFTLRSLMQTQPDIEEYGKVFSWTFILVCNIAGIIAWMLCVTDVSLKSVIDSLCLHSISAYRSVYYIFLRCIEIIKSV